MARRTTQVPLQGLQSPVTCVVSTRLASFHARTGLHRREGAQGIQKSADRKLLAEDSSMRRVGVSASGKLKQQDCCEFEATLGHTVSSRPARAIEQVSNKMLTTSLFLKEVWSPATIAGGR